MESIHKKLSALSHVHFFKKPRHHPYVTGAFLSVFLFFMACFGLVVANAQTIGPDDIKVVDVYEDGELRYVPTRAATLAEFIAKQNIQLSEDDLIEPNLDTIIDQDNFEVRIFRGKPVSITEGQETRRLISPYQEPRLIAQKAGYNLDKADRAEWTDGFGVEPVRAIRITRAQTHQINLYGTLFTHKSHANVVADILGEAGVVVAEGDTVEPSLTSNVNSDTTITISRFGTQVVTVTEEIPFTVDRQQDPNLSVSYREIKKAGVKGIKTVTYEIVYKNDIESSRKVVREYIEQEPEAQVEVVGTLSNYSGSLQEWLLALRQCEAGGVYTRNTGNGFYGAYQFMISTWNRIAPKAGRPDLVGVRPDLASPNDQDMMIIANTKLSNGGLATQNPGCYRKLGLSQFPPE